MLIPPVQDTRISGCINEPKKIVAPNFSTSKSRIINGEALKTSLLESIIRVRLDKLSGRSDFSTINIDDTEAELTSDDYGILESLFIIRIRSAIKALATKVNGDIDNLRSLYETTGGSTASLPIDSPPIKEPSVVEDKSISLLRKQKIIEDSIMALLDDNSASQSGLNLQNQTQRNTSVIDSHLMGGIFSIIDLPRDRLRSKLAEEDNNRINRSNGPAGIAENNIALCLGLSKGVGAFDLLIFVLALFTMPEDQLLGLLDNLEYARMLETFAGSGNVISAKKVETISAVNTLTQYLLSGYELLVSDLNDGASVLSYLSGTKVASNSSSEGIA